MHTIGTPVDVIFSALSSFCSTLSTQFAQLISRPSGAFGVAAFVVTSLVLAVSCAAWALVERARRSLYRGHMRNVLHRSQLACHFRDAILESLPEMVVVLRSKAHEQLSFGGGAALLQQCLDGPDARPLATAIDDLLRHSSGFSLSVRISSLRHVFVRGVRVGGAAALFLRAQEPLAGWQPVQSQSPGTVDAKPRRGGGAQQSAASSDGAVIIGPDGRVKKWNRAFARQWSLRDNELRGEPLWAELAARSGNGRDAVWDIVSYAATSPEPERLNDWGTVTDANGKRLLLSITRLKDGTTLVRFCTAALSSSDAMAA